MRLDWDGLRLRPGWFEPKVFGWGAAPRSWQGWATTVTYLAVAIGVALAFDPQSVAYWALEALALSAFLFVVARTFSAEPPERT